MTDDSLGKDDATEVARKIKAGEVTALQIAKDTIKRIHAVEPKLDALTHECFVEGELDAQRYNQGEFSGVPIVIKDNLDVKGLPTQMGTKAFVAKPAKKTDPMAKQVLAQGFTLLAKSTTPEFGFNGTTEFQDGSHTKNPWNTAYSSGGSSGGSAALVASGALPIAHGNDGGGSIRIPASACGLFGLKSSRGRLVVSEMAKQLPVNMISDGVITRTVRDTANFMFGAEQYYHNPKFPPIGRVIGANKKRLNIILLKESVTQEANDDATNETLEKTVALLEKLGHKVTVKPQPIPKEFTDGFLNYYGFVGFLVANFGKVSFGMGFDASKLETLSHGLKDYYKKNFYKTPKAIQLYRKAHKTHDDFIKNYDLVLSPVTGFTAPKIGYLSPALPYDEIMPRLIRYASYTAIHNVLGTPAMTVPLGFTNDADGTRPLGMQFAGRAGDEKMLLELAFELEEAQPFKHMWDI